MIWIHISPISLQDFTDFYVRIYFSRFFCTPPLVLKCNKSLCEEVRVCICAEDEAKKLKIRKENLFREILEKEKMSQWHGVEWRGGILVALYPIAEDKALGPLVLGEAASFNLFMPLHFWLQGVSLSCASLLIWLTLGEQWLMVEIRIEI